MDRNSYHPTGPALVFVWGLLIAVPLVGFVLFARAPAQAPAPRVANPPLAQVQFGIRRFQAGDDADILEGLFLPVDRETSRQLGRANELLAQHRYSDAATLLDEMLQREEDCFFKPDEDQPLHRSLKAEANRLIGSMPPEGRKAYELQFGARAAHMLKAAAAVGDIPALEEIARRFFHTRAGYEASLLLGRSHLDHQRPLAAALCFQRVRETPEAAAQFEPGLSILLATSWVQAGDEARAREVLLDLKKNYPRAAVQVGSRTLNLFQKNEQALDWLTSAFGKRRPTVLTAGDAWMLFRGDPARNAVSAGGMPLLNPRWRIPTTNHPALEDALAGMRDRYIEQGVAALPSMQPLAVGDLVLMRTARNLLAVDFMTGKRVGMPTSGFSSDELLPNSATGDSRRFDPQLNPALAERFWGDATFGTFASDGENVYILDDLEIAAGQGYTVMMRGRRNRRMIDPAALLNASFNKLAAHELRSELKLKWSVGGDDGDDEPKLAGAFFLGPPLPLQGNLYVLAEIKGEIKLVVLDPATGKLRWSQQVAVVEQNITAELIRRLAGCTPSYADGVLICPTAAGAVVAVDLANRSLLWGYQYPRNPQQNGIMIRGPAVMVNGQWTGPGGMAAERWYDSTATIAENCVLLTPPESDELHCLNLLDGTPLWKRPREDYLYLAGIHGGSAIVIGKHNMAAFRLNDGSPAWPSGVVQLPANAMPSGRGFLAGNRYYLPLTSAEVAAIDLNRAEITARQKSRRGAIPGNLICFRGEVISQGVDYLETFFQIEPLQQRIAAALAKNPEDAWALAHRGEIALEEGRVGEAIEDIRRSYKADPAPFTRDLLVEVLLAGLSQDFAAYRDSLPELEQIATLPSQRAAYLRVVAAGLQKEDDPVGALNAYFKLASLEPSSMDSEQIDDALSVSRARWIRARCNELLAGAGPEARREIDARLRDRFEQLAAADSPRTLRSELECFGNHPGADRLRERLIELLTTPETMLEREQLLMQLERSADPGRRKTAMAQLAKLMIEALRDPEALACYRRIQQEFGDQPVVDGKSVKKILAELPPESKIGIAMTAETPWPTGAVQAERRGSHVPPLRSQPVDLRGDPGPFFHDVNISFDQQQSNLVLRDGKGVERFRVSLMEGARATTNFPTGPVQLFHATVTGHCLVLCTNLQVIGIDTLRSSNSAGGRILWKEDFFEQAGSPFGSSSVQSGISPRNWGGGSDISRSPGPQLRVAAPAGRNGVVLLRGRELICVDLLTGKQHWALRGIPQGSDVFGDDEFVVVAPPDDQPAMIVRVIDGQILGNRSIPPAEQRWLSVGRNLLIARSDNGGKTIALYDTLDERERWSREFQSHCRGEVVEGNTLAMMQADGKFVMLSLDDGGTLAEQMLEPEPSLQHIYLLRDAERDFLITTRPFTARSANRNFISPFPEMAPMINGRVYALDRTTGTPAWPVPATIEHHSLVLNQGRDLPALVFVRNISNFGQAHPSRMRGSLLCIDKRTGRLLYEDDDLPQQIGIFDAIADPTERSLTVTTGQQAVTLRFTDDPVSPEPPYQAGLYDKVRPTPRENAALLKALGINEDSPQPRPARAMPNIRRVPRNNKE